MFNNLLSPNNIINLIKNTADYQKIFLTLINSEEFKNFVEFELGLKYESLKENMTAAYFNCEKSEQGLRQQKQIEEGQKLLIYKELAKSLIEENGLSVYSGIILAAGFVGIDQTKVVNFLKSKGYSASKTRIENYYKVNEGFLKQVLKKKGKIIPGWNDELESTDLELEINDNNKLLDLPNNSVEDELGIEEK